jgi:hypothetical protein
LFARKWTSQEYLDIDGSYEIQPNEGYNNNENGKNKHLNNGSIAPFHRPRRASLAIRSAIILGIGTRDLDDRPPSSFLLAKSGCRCSSALSVFRNPNKSSIFIGSRRAAKNKDIGPSSSFSTAGLASAEEVATRARRIALRRDFKSGVRMKRP